MQNQSRTAASVRTERRIIGCLVAVGVLLLVAATALVMLFAMSSKFRISHVEQIAVGDSRARVIEIMGEPHTCTENTFEYYSDNYRRAQSGSDGETSVAVQRLSVGESAQEAEEDVYQYVAVTFDGEGVVSVFLDANRTEQTKDAVKEVNGSIILEEEVYAHTTCTVSYHTEYTDGSYYMGVTTVTPGAYGSTTVGWDDPYGNRCSCPVEASVNPAYPSGNGWYLVPDSQVLYIYADGAYGVPKDVAAVNFQNGVTALEADFFSDWPSLQSITLGGGITELAPGVFAECASVQRITLGSGIKALRAGVFEGCFSLQTLSLGNGVEVIEAGVLADCPALSGVTIGTGMTAVSSDVFSGCTSLRSVTIGQNVTVIEAGAFAGCDQLTSVTFRTTEGWTAAGNALDVSDPARNAENLSDAYAAFGWTRDASEE